MYLKLQFSRADRTLISILLGFARAVIEVSSCHFWTSSGMFVLWFPVPDNFVLVADMTSVKLQSLDVGDEGGDRSTYTLVQGNGYFSNFAGLAFDSISKLVFFSDVNRFMFNNSMSTSTSKSMFRLHCHPTSKKLIAHVFPAVLVSVVAGERFTT